MRFIVPVLFAAAWLGIVPPASSQVLQRDTTLIIATDYAIQAPATVPAGAHTFLMINRGKEPHMIGLTRLDSRHDAAQTVDLWLHEKPTPWAFDHSGPNVAAAGDTSNATIVLTPGRYALICYFKALDGKLHFMKGMYSQFEVLPVRVERKPPQTNATIILSNYRIDVSRNIGRGLYSFRVENRGPDDHDVQLVRINRGRSAQEVMDWFESPAKVRGAAPGTPLGGVVGMDKGRSAYFTARFGPGEYLIFCFVPDEQGKPHFRHGMIDRFTVR